MISSPQSFSTTLWPDLIISVEVITFHLPEIKENGMKQISHDVKKIPRHRYRAKRLAPKS